MKILELSDAVSLFTNKMDTLTKSIVRTGIVKDSGIVIEYLDELGDELFVTCTVDGVKTSLLLTVEKRLAHGDSRSKMIEKGFEFLFEDTSDAKPSNWKFVKDLSDDEYHTKYAVSNEFHDSYTESPLRSLTSSKDLEVRMIIYYPIEGRTLNVDGIFVLEIGNDLTNNSGLITYYNFREILESDINYL